MGAHASRHELVFGRSVWTLTMMPVMRIGGEAPGGGPILSVGICATSATGSRHLGSSTGSPRSGCQYGRRVGKEMISRRLFSLPDAE
jgi:hypothetical protein